MNINSQKRGQVTIFIIVAIVIVVLGVLLFLFYPKISTTSTFDVENPEAFIQDCVEDDLNDLIQTLSKHGISIDPVEPFAWYEQEKLQYLCYTPNYDEACARSPPFLIESFQEEISENIKPIIDSCFESLKQSYESKSYTVVMKKSLRDPKTAILPEQINIGISNYELTITKQTTGKYVSFNIILNNNLYELLNLASNILGDDVQVGQADKSKYMLENIGLEVTGPEYTDGTNIYVIKDKNTGQIFQFASRSWVSQPGV